MSSKTRLSKGPVPPRSSVAPIPPIPILRQPTTAIDSKWRNSAIKSQPNKIKGNFHLPFSLGSKAHKSSCWPEVAAVLLSDGEIAAASRSSVSA